MSIKTTPGEALEAAAQATSEGGLGLSPALINDDLAEAKRECADSREHPNSYGHGYDVGFLEGLKRYAPALIDCLECEAELLDALRDCRLAFSAKNLKTQQFRALMAQAERKAAVAISNAEAR